MESKIEKLPSFIRTEDNAMDYCNREKINELVEAWNSQSQPEEYEEPEEVKCHCGKCGKEIESMNLQGEWACEECEGKDTPEEWEDKIDEIFREGYSITTRKKVLDCVEQLLEDKEKKTITTFLKDTASYNHFYKGEPRVMKNSKGEGYEIIVNLLNNKKK